MRDSDIETLALIGIGVVIGVMVVPTVQRIHPRHIRFANKVVIPAIKEVLEKV